MRGEDAGSEGVSKYGNHRLNTTDGWFDSQKEYKRWCELKLLEKVGKIQNLKRQVRYELVPRIGRHRPTYYFADFEYVENGRTVVEDVKGYRDRLYLLKRKLMMFRHQIEVFET